MFWRPLPLACLSLLLFLCACQSPQQQAEKKVEATPDPPLTGRQAFQRMYPSARTWASDAQPLQLQSFNLTQIKTEDGKAGAWRAIFVSPARGRSRTYSWSAIEGDGDLTKGVFAGQEQAWSGPSGQEHPYLVAAIRTDSDQAYQTALKQKATAAYLKKSAGKPVVFILEQTPRFADVAWRVLWGESVSASEYSVFVDASTGQFLQMAF